MIGSRIRELRTSILNMSQLEFSKILGISQGALSEIESGGRGLPIEAAERLAKYSLKDNRIDITWILTGRNKQEYYNSREKSLITSFRTLDERGKNTVEYVARYENEYYKNRK